MNIYVHTYKWEQGRERERERRSSPAFSAQTVTSDLWLSNLMVSSLSSSCLTDWRHFFWSGTLSLKSPYACLQAPLAGFPFYFSDFSSASSLPPPHLPEPWMPRDSVLKPPLFSSHTHPSPLHISVQVKSPASFSWASRFYPVCPPSRSSCHSPSPAQLISSLFPENARILSLQAFSLAIPSIQGLMTSPLSGLCLNVPPFQRNPP